MRDIDRYLLLTGLIIFAGFLGSSGVNYPIEILRQTEYGLIGLMVFAILVGISFLKHNRNRSTNN